MEFTKELIVQVFVFRILWTEGVRTDTVDGRLAVQYGGDYMSQRRIYEWTEMLKGGWT